jgi:pyrimidine operon attenuation protein/uracil phosphoribosyltransferase
MPIYRLLQNMPMGPEEISRLTTAYEQALRTMGIVDRGDPLAELLAKKIIEIAQASASRATFLLWRSRKSASQRRSLHGAPTSLIVTRKRFSLAAS